MRIWIIAALTLLIQGVSSLLGFLVGLIVVGFVLGYRRAWEVTMPEPTRIVEDEDD